MAAKNPPFVHLHLHSEYSLLDGANRIDRLIARVHELGMTAVALTDHGNLFGAVEFYTAAREKGIKPILGIEAYVAPGERTDKTYKGIADGGHHLVLLAENITGWRNLLKLSSDSYINGFYYKPRMDKATLAQWGDGLIAINGHLGSSIAALLTQYVQTKDPTHYRAALEEARWHAGVFKPAPASGSAGTPASGTSGGARFYLELQRHQTPEQDAINPYLMQMARELGLPLVADNDAHFLMADDHDAHDSLCCISMGKTKNDESRLKYPRELYVKGPEQMAELFKDVPEAIENTWRIAERCNVELEFGRNLAPAVKVARKKGLGPRAEGRGEGKEGLGSGVWGLGKEKKGLAGAASGSSSLDPRPQTPDPASLTPGSTEWFAAVCAQYTLEPFDSEADKTPPEAVKGACDLALRELAEAGAVWRYGPGGVDGEKRARLERELKILADKNISAYFLIVWDFVNEARARGFPANARGSGVGTMVGYCLGLSNACPVEYGLLFERFTDPDRSEFPDIDIDICQDGRQEIIEYVRRKYGHVAQIITFGTLKARAAIRDVGRVHNMPLAEVDKICKLIGDGLSTTIDSALEQEPDLRKLYEENPLCRQVIDTGKRLEGLCRHSGVHAAGVIIATQPLENIIPLSKPVGQDAQIVTQWDGPTCDKIGLLKMDFLGLRTLSIIERARKLVRQSFGEEAIRGMVGGGNGSGVWGLGSREEMADGGRRMAGGGEGPGSGVSGLGEEGTGAESQASSLKPQASSSRDPRPQTPDPLDLDRLRYDDPKVLELFSRGETAGVFQFESGGMRNLLMAMKPDRFEDLIAANALYRPGPMDLIPDYNARKHGRQAVPKSHEIVARYTDETYGIMVYQEQVMQIVHGLGGIPLRAAYSLIKAISKKKQKDIDAVRPTFVKGAMEKKLPKDKAEELFDLILKFAGYGFNKSHSTGYAIVAYQTAYLKTYFPLQYMAAVLTYESVSTDKVVEYMEECRKVMLPNGRRGVAVRPPDINLSDVAFSVVFDPGEKRDANSGHIRFGLSAVKGVGDKAIAAIIAARQKGTAFKDLYDFCERMPLGSVNKATVEALVKCGAFDSLHGAEKRAAMLEALEGAMQAGQRAAAARESGQLTFFAPGSFAPAPGSAPGSVPGSVPGSAPGSVVSGSTGKAGKGTAAAIPGTGVALPSVTPWSNHEMLAHEKGVLGFYISSHPLDEYRETLERFASVTVADVRRLGAETQVVVGGMLTRIRPTVVKNGRSAGSKMAMITIEDKSGSIEGVVFSDAFAVASPLLTTDRIVFLKGKVDRRREEPSIVVDRIIAITDAERDLTQTVNIVLRDGQAAGKNELATLKALLRQAGNTQNANGGGSGGGNGYGNGSGGGSSGTGAGVTFEVHQEGQVVRLRASGVRVAVDAGLPGRVDTVLRARGSCQLVGPAKLLNGGKAAGVVMHEEGARTARPLTRKTAEAEEFCESIDRY